MRGPPEAAFCLWLTGLPASGKSTLAGALVRALLVQGVDCVVLESDALRRLYGPAMAYDAAGRRQFYATVRRLATRLAVAGVPVIVDATATERAERHAARAALPRFAEVWVSTPLEQCRQRDPKGLYRASDAGEITHLPGVGSTYEPPLDPEFIYPGADVAPAQFAEQVVHQLAGWGWLSPEGRLE